MIGKRNQSMLSKRAPRLQGPGAFYFCKSNLAFYFIFFVVLFALLAGIGWDRYSMVGGESIEWCEILEQSIGEGNVMGEGR